MRIPAIITLLCVIACSNEDPGSAGTECGPNGTCPAGFSCSAMNLCIPSSAPDARLAIDGAVAAHADALVAAPDARQSSAPDAAVVPSPDAAVGSPDAAFGAPDGAVSVPDARASAPDAATPPSPPDGPAPVETQIDSQPPALTNDGTATFTFSSSTPGATFACAVDSTPFAACTSPAQISGLADGDHTFAVRASAHGVTDPTPATASWTLDTTPPTVTLLGPSGGVTTGIHVMFTFASEPGAILTCALDDAALAACPSGAAQLDIAAAGAHTFQVVATDGAGNAGSASSSFTVDTSVATVTITPATRNHTIETATIAYAASSPSTIFCRLDGGAFATCPATGFSFTDAPAGPHTIAVHAVNALGNLGPDATYSWSVDGPLTVTALNGNTPFDVQVITDGPPLSGVVGYQARTDANGVATLHVPEGGIVRFSNFNLQLNLETEFVMTDVHGYENLHIGLPSPGPSVTGTLSRTLPPLPSGANCVYDQIDTGSQGCSTFASPKTLSVGGGALDSSGKLNLLSVASSAFGNGPIVGYAWAPGITFVPGGTATAAAPSWLTPVPTTFTLSNVAATTFFQAGIAQNGLVYPISGSFHPVAAGAGPTNVVTPMPPTGVGRPVFQVSRASGTQGTQQVRTDATQLTDSDFLPVPQGFAFVLVDRDSGFTFQPPSGAKGVVTNMTWTASQGGFFHLVIVTPPTTTTAAFAEIGVTFPPTAGADVQVTQVGIDVASWSEADFQQGFMPLYGSTQPGFPVPDFGPGNPVRVSSSNQSVTETMN